MLTPDIDKRVPMVTAAKHFGISATKVSRLAKQGKITAQNKWGDERVKLVSITEIKDYLDRVARGELIENRHLKRRSGGESR